MTAHDLMNTALISRGILPLTSVCPCCGDGLHRDDMMGSAFRADVTEALVTRYGAPVCFACADAHTLCDDCGMAIHEDDTDKHAECLDAIERSETLDDLHKRQERHGWEQV